MNKHFGTLADFIKKHIFGLAAFFLVTGVGVAHAAENAHGSAATTFIWIAIILIIAKLAGLVEKVGQPSVLGELVAGVVLGNLALIGLPWFEAIKTDAIIRFLAEFGAVILLFQIGLESNVEKIKKVGIAALLVALIGVAAPFVLGTYVFGPLLLPELDMTALIFLGATLTATSVGITARVFKDLKKLQTKEAQIILGAAVIDDILGLILLAIVSALATTGTVSVGAVSLITIKSASFLVGAILAGRLIAEWLGRLFSKIHTGTGMKFTLAVCFGLAGAYLANLIGLAPIVGAFAAGLVLDPVHFRFFIEPNVVKEIKEEASDLPEEKREKITGIIRHHAHKHVEDLIEPVGMLFVPLFFVVAGMDVGLGSLADIKIVGIALAITAVAIVGKLLSGLASGKGVNKLLIGFGMVPRGEVGLIFAAIGRSLNVINEQIFSILVIVMILTTLITPPIVAALLKRMDAKAASTRPA